MGQTGKRNIFDELTNKLSNVSIPDTGTGIDFDTFKNNALNKIKGSDAANLLKSDNLLTSEMTATDVFNSFSNKIAGTMDVDFKELADSIGVKALPSDSSLDADFFKQAVDKMKSVSIKEGMVLDDQDAMQKFNELNDKLSNVSVPTNFGSFNQMINDNEGTLGVDYIGDGFEKMKTALKELSPESSNENIDNTDKFPRSNVLHNYAPYNYILSLSCINIDQFENNNSNGLLIAKNGGAGGSTFDGLDYYIDNLVIRNSVSPTELAGTASAYQILFNVTEPYGVKFIDSLIKAATQQGYVNHMQAVYNLKIDFKGMDDELAPKDIPTASRHIPIHIYAIDMVVEAGVTTYQIQAAPAHYSGLNDIYNFVSEDVNAYGNTVGEIVNSFFERYTEVQRRRNKDGLILQPDEFELDVKGSEDILSSPVGYDQNSAPHRTKNVSILQSDGPPGQPGRKVSVAKGTNIVEFLNKVVIESEYYRNKFDDNNKLVDKDSDGFTKYLRIFTKTNILSPDNGSGRQAVKIKYYLRSQRVSAQHLNYDNNEDLVSNVKASRTYDYLYTGKNTEVLNYSAQFNMLFQVSTDPRKGFNTSNSQQERKGTNIVAPVFLSDIPVESDYNNVIVNYPRTYTVSSAADQTNNEKTPTTNELEASYAQSYAERTADTQVIEVDIIGDPYLLGIPGAILGNVSQKTLANVTATSDIFVAFVSYFPMNKEELENPFDKGPMDLYTSGVYELREVEHRFQQGQYLSKLRMYRDHKTSTYYVREELRNL